MNLIIDEGNTRTKIYIFENNKIIEKYYYKQFTSKHLESIEQEFLHIEHAILSCASNNFKANFSFLSQKFPNLLILGMNTPIPLTNDYNTPETLGNDRIALAVGANNIFPHSNVLVIDLGTAITYEMVNSKNQYLGGNISPGLEMRFKALNFFTKKLPLVSKSTEFPILGKSSNNAIVAGVQQGILFEIEKYIEEFGQRFANLKVLITGGDANFFVKPLKKTIFAEPNLLGIGLNRILNYNVEN